MKSFIRLWASAFLALWGVDVSLAQVISIVNVTGNNTNLWTSGNGSIAFNAPAGTPGLRLDNQLGTLVHAGGLFLGGLKSGQSGTPDTVNVAQTEFFTEFQRGRILNSGDLGTLIPEDLWNPATSIFVLPQDYSSWPPEAPRDVNGLPLQISANDTWCVFNDLDDSLAEPLLSPAPVFGIMAHRQTFQLIGGAFDNSVLVRMKLFNRSDRSYPGFYIGLWSDATVGIDPDNNLPGSDSSLGLIYVFNGAYDADHVAYGTTLLQGPLVTGDPLDTARVVTVGITGLETVVLPGFRLLHASSVTAYPNDPSGNCGQNLGDLCRYNYLRGLTADGDPKLWGPFSISDDPYDPYVGNEPGTDRVMVSCGPFTFAAGDSQEIWYAMVGAVAATDSGAVDTIRTNVRTIRSTFFNNMQYTVVEVQRAPRTRTETFVLEQNAPNPFNSSTTIRFELASSAHVSIQLYDVLGREVGTLMSGTMPVGTHRVVWNGTNKSGRNVPSGVYFCRLKAGEFSSVRKMLILK